MAVASVPLSLLGLGARSYLSIIGGRGGRASWFGAGIVWPANLWWRGMTQYVALSKAAGQRPINSISLLSVFVSSLSASVQGMGILHTW
jgi:hypothetical protein